MFERALNVNVSVPETIEVKVVDASALADYEMWLFFASFLANAVVGFGVAYFQDQTKTYLLAVTLMFSVLLLAAATFAFYKRDKLRQKTKVVCLRASEIISDREGT